MKRFLIIGNYNAVIWKDVFPHITDNSIWLGVNKRGMDFITPDGLSNINAVWFTNLDNEKRHTPLKLTKTYNPIDYPKYDNYDVINVDKTNDIPKDYDGLMGVSKTIALYSPEQFEIVDVVNNPYINGKAIYTRIIVKLVRNEQDKQRQSTQG